MTKTQIAVIEWLANGDTGASSETMAYWLAFHVKKHGLNYPWDIHDLKRCFKLLKIAPELRFDISEMAKLSTSWRKIIKEWEWLEQANDKDVNDFLYNISGKTG